VAVLLKPHGLLVAIGGSGGINAADEDRIRENLNIQEKN